jgi:hypothetical protein
MVRSVDRYVRHSEVCILPFRGPETGSLLPSSKVRRPRRLPGASVTRGDLLVQNAVELLPSTDR